MTLGGLIKQYRTEHNLTMQDFANKSGLSKGYVSMLEKNRHPQNNKEIIPSIETYSKVAKAMSMTLNQLMEAVSSDQLIEVETTTNIATIKLAPDEKDLLIVYRRMNEEGQEKVLDYAHDLDDSRKYKKRHQSGMVEEETA